MTIDNKVLAIGAGALIVGFAFGYVFAAGVAVRGCCGNGMGSIPLGMHRMADGSMMGNDGMGMRGMMDGMMSGLSGKTGDAFDQAFLQEMIVHHEGAVAMAEAALKQAKHQEIKDLAQGIIAAQNTEIASMRSWLSAWYGVSTDQD